MKKNTDILNKLQLETTNTGVIHLWLEGMFWKAYERSAYIFSQRIGDYKPYKRWIKAVGGEIVAIGFPAKTFDKITDGRISDMISDKHCLISGFTMDKQELKNFQEWKKRISSFPYQIVDSPIVEIHSVQETSLENDEEKKTLQTKKSGKTDQAIENLKQRLEKAEGIIEELRRFRMESATPLECMFFLANLIKKIENQ